MLTLPICMIILVAVGSCSGQSTSVRPDRDGPVTIRVPQDASSISTATESARPGDVIEISPGTYSESVQVSTENLTLRGSDRNAVILDGGGVKSSGVVVTASGVRVENLTIRNYTLNGVLITGMSDESGGLARGSDGYRRLDPEQFPPLQGFAVRYVTAANNGLYGIYVFDSQHGVIEHNYASGSSDSGIYLGQCRDCDTVVRHNVAELNAVGYEQANASDSVVVAANRFSDNRVGLTLLSDYQEAFVPQHGTTVAGNVISNNDAVHTPNHADGGFGIGIGLSGAQQNVLRENLIIGHPTAGVQLASAEDIPPKDNQLIDNRFGDNGLDLAYTASDRAPGSGNCIAGEVKSTAPKQLSDLWRCPAGGASASGTTVKAAHVPDGISFRDVRAPKAQQQMPNAARDVPAGPPQPSEEETTLPDADHLEEWTNGDR